MLGVMFRSMKGLGARPLFSSGLSAGYCSNHQHHKYNHWCDHEFEKLKRENPDYKRLLDGNKIFIDSKVEQNPEYFKKLAKGQHPKYLFIGCADSRVPPNELTNTGPGELFIHRNVANLVLPTDFNSNSVIQFAVEVLKVEHIIVMGHTQCGGIKASMDGQYHGMIDQWLGPIRDIYQKYSLELNAIEDLEDRVRRLTEFVIKEQVLNLCKNQFVQKAWAKKQPLDVHGWLCEVETGKIIDLEIQRKEWEEIKSIYRLQYSKDQLGKS